jgi:hypothetical protein
MCRLQERTKRSLPCQVVSKYCSSTKDKASVTCCQKYGLKKRKRYNRLTHSIPAVILRDKSTPQSAGYSHGLRRTRRSGQTDNRPQGGAHAQGVYTGL